MLECKCKRELHFSATRTCKALDCMNGHSLTHSSIHSRFMLLRGVQLPLSVYHSLQVPNKTKIPHPPPPKKNTQIPHFPPTQVFMQTPKNSVINVKTFFCLTFHPFSGFLLTFVKTTTFHIHFTIIAGRMSYWFQNIWGKKFHLKDRAEV